MKSRAPKVKTGQTPKTIKEAQPQAVPMRYAMAAGITNAVGKNPTTYDKKRGK